MCSAGEDCEWRQLAVALARIIDAIELDGRPDENTRAYALAKQILDGDRAGVSNQSPDAGETP